MLSVFVSVLLPPLLVLLSSSVALVQADGCPPRPPLQPDLQVDEAVQAALAGWDTLMAAAVEKEQIPGLIATAVYDQTIIWQKGYGKRNFTDPTSPPPDGDSIVRVASISKVFTDLMLFQLRDGGVVSLDDPVVAYVPNFSIKDPYVARGLTSRPITLKQLASHLSGLPRENPCGFDICTEKQVLSMVASQYLLYPRAKRAHYSNLGISLLGRALGHAAGTEFEDYMDKNVLSPLNMTYSSFRYTDFIKAHIAVGSDSGKPADIVPPGWDAPCGGLFASSNDIAKMAAMMFRRGVAGPEILDGSTIEEVLKPAIELEDGNEAFGFPWEFQYLSRYWVKSKAGELNGYRSQLALVPDLKLALFTSALQNDVSDPSVYTKSGAALLIPAVEAQMWRRHEDAPLPTNVSALLGVYSDRFGNVFNVTLSPQGTALLVNNVLNFTLYEFAQPGEWVFRAHMLDNSRACRELEDGPHEELAYFTFQASSAAAAPTPVLPSVSPTIAVAAAAAAAGAGAGPMSSVGSWTVAFMDGVYVKADHSASLPQ